MDNQLIANIPIHYSANVCSNPQFCNRAFCGETCVQKSRRHKVRRFHLSVSAVRLVLSFVFALKEQLILIHLHFTSFMSEALQSCLRRR